MRSFLTVLPIFLLLLAACGQSEPAATLPTIEGPALIMYYTDG